MFDILSFYSFAKFPSALEPHRDTPTLGPEPHGGEGARVYKSNIVFFARLHKKLIQNLPSEHINCTVMSATGKSCTYWKEINNK